MSDYRYCAVCKATVIGSQPLCAKHQATHSFNWKYCPVCGTSLGGPHKKCMSCGKAWD